MAHSIQQVGERTEVLGDVALLIAVNLAVREIRNYPIQYSSLQALARQWETDRDGWGLGCIELGLQDVASSATLKAEFLSLLSAVRKGLEQAGPTLPASELNSWAIAPDVFFEADGRVAPVVDVVDALERLVREDVSTQAQDK